MQRHKEMHPGEARSYLAQYLFRGEEVFTPVNVLSGGERARLALAILGLEGANFLLLDEPTNHLDIPAREALQEVLANFQGTILLVSHDRYLVDQLATQIWDIRRAKLEIFQGAYREFVLRSTFAADSDRVRETAVKRKVLMPVMPLIKLDSREARKRVQAIGQLEERIRQQETAVQRLSSELQKISKMNDYARLHQVSGQMAQAQAHLEGLMEEWERLAVT